ncbi:protein phosphatase 2C domain-containing protein [Streptomyces acidiscabies]|uniref:protein phosphatase 2C domain-containing protein n=1 Tax=Streptomyces acidiscabies TaxID=42234 RepID=UPI0038F7D33C
MLPDVVSAPVSVPPPGLPPTLHVPSSSEASAPGDVVSPPNVPSALDASSALDLPSAPETAVLPDAVSAQAPAPPPGLPPVPYVPSASEAPAPRATVSAPAPVPPSGFASASYVPSPFEAPAPGDVVSPPNVPSAPDASSAPDLPSAPELPVLPDAVSAPTSAPPPGLPPAPHIPSSPEAPAPRATVSAPAPAPPPGLPPTPHIPSSPEAPTPQDAASTPAPPPDTPLTRTTLDEPRPHLKPYIGSGPPTYDADPTALPLADPDALDDLVADTVLDGARYGAGTLRAVSLRGDSARYRGEPRRDALLTARFGYGENALVLVAMATGARATVGAHRAAAEVCRWIGRAVGRSHVRLAEDIRAGRRGDLKSGLHRLTDRSLGRLRAGAAEQGLTPEEYTATLRCLLLSADPECRTRVFFGVGEGGLFRLRGGEWQDIEPAPGEPGPAQRPRGTLRTPLPHTRDATMPDGTAPADPYAAGPRTLNTPGPHNTHDDHPTPDLGSSTDPRHLSPYDHLPPPDPFLFRTSVAQPGDTLLMCTAGLADPLRGELELAGHLTARWAGAPVPGLAEFLADIQIRVKGYADDRTAAAVWEA